MYCAVILVLCVMQMGLVVAEDLLTEEQMNACKVDTGYDGAFNETTPQMKCFMACTMKKVGVMNEKDGSFDVDKMSELWREEEDNDSSENSKEEYEKFIETAVKPCATAKPSSSDHCEIAFEFLICMVPKESRHRKAVRDTRFSTIVRTITWMYFPR